jgi:Alkylmercury lyase
MCALDALGISSMTGEDTRIESVDVTTGRSITVTMSSEGSTWDPDSAVVFLGSDARGGPSADCCCDYLNFFTDASAATTWATAHPHIAGQILARPEAEALATRLFGSLLS